MRYKYIALLALIIMFIGVMGIYQTSGGEDGNEDKSPIQPAVKVEYFVANHDLFLGAIVSERDFSKREHQSHNSILPQWLSSAISSEQYHLAIKQGVIMNSDVVKDSVLTEDMIVSFASEINNGMAALPISVNRESLKNSGVIESGFVDIYLISNDDKPYNADIYYKEHLNRDENANYKSTRVKKFATKVWITIPDSRSYFGLPSDSETTVGDSKSMIRAWFKYGDEEKVIQAQILGSFFVLPAKVEGTLENLANINIGAREITPADIVSGAPMPENRSKIIEIRGAANAIRND